MDKSNYDKIILRIFNTHYHDGDRHVHFTRQDIVKASRDLGIDLPKNLGDVVYSYRYRKLLPKPIREAAPNGFEWYIKGVGAAKYVFELSSMSSRIAPREDLIVTKIPDATPEIIRSAAGNDEQALLAIVRYNRLIDVFLGISAYSLQNHLRTTVKSIGQVEVDEIYVALDSFGQQYIIPVEAKGHNDQLGRVQAEQDLAVCADKWPEYTPLAIAVQFMSDNVVAMFELAYQKSDILVVKEKHYKLVKASEISEEDRSIYKQAAIMNSGM
ncbi:hypothetical protein [Bifidobacterium sp. A11]|uniref:hypothetical protein n=1 Tax=Bifidobacterium sp. A11 TaxID=1394176 RepID=UPI00055435D5|nr:hypothetical protein [Bifidobacterium sp. A11]